MAAPTMDAGLFAGIGAIGSIASAYGSYEQGVMMKQTDEFNAAVAAKQAEVTRQADKITQFKMKQQMDIAIGDQQTAYAASGVVAITGSALDVMVSSMSNALLDMALDRYNTEVAARGLQAQSDKDILQGKMDYASGVGKSMTVLVGGMSNYAQKMMSTSPSPSTSTDNDPQSTLFGITD